VDDGGEGGDEADDGERGHDGEEDLGRLPHVAAPHGCFSLRSVAGTVVGMYCSAITSAAGVCASTLDSKPAA
jgi:hypothetical protein